MGYARDLAAGGGRRQSRFCPAAEAGDDDAVGRPRRLKGIGRWSAEIYLIFALGRPDIWPAADLGLQIGVGECLGLASAPGRARVARARRAWRPWRSVAACLFWQSYLHARNRTAPVLPPELYASGA